MHEQIARSLDLRGMAGSEVTRVTMTAMRGLRPGSLVEVLSDDPVTARDFAVWPSEGGSKLLESSRFGSLFRFVVRKGPGLGRPGE